MLLKIVIIKFFFVPYHLTHTQQPPTRTKGMREHNQESQFNNAKPITDRLIRQAELLKLIGCSRSSLYREISHGSFPAPVKIGQRAVAWRASEIKAWMENLPKTSEIGG
ncbi:MAG: AlpA family transcriptional regulator [Pseudomonadota bacterium]|nr:AlpA family transcriptional regulator [Pseudomonadota bacterium]